MARNDYDDGYDNPADLDAEGMPSIEEPINVDEGVVPPGDTPKAADDYGVTASEQRTGESVADRAERENPDPLRQETEPHDRYVTDGDLDVVDIDDEKDVTAGSVEQTGTAPVQEEDAVRVREEPYG